MIFYLLGFGLAIQCVNALQPEMSSPSLQLGTTAVSNMRLLQTTPPIRYRDLYSMLDTKLNSILSYIDAQWTGTVHDVCYSVELIAANGHRGEELLKPESIQAITLMLDRLKALGIRGVKVAVKYPLLRPDFPNSKGYLNFYARVSQEVKARNLILYVATTAAFRDPSFTSLRVDYTGLTFQQFKKELRQQVETVIAGMQPDYLTFANEPETEAMNTGLEFSVQNMRELAEYILNGLDRKGTLIGAGAGTWDKIEYFQSLAQIANLDYLDMHIYPINSDFVIDKAIRVAKIAKDNGKKLLLSETWLYKVWDRELGTATAAAAELFARDVFSFWSPLDQKFIEAMVKLSHLLRIDLCSFFWMQYFYAYIEYDEQKNAMKPSQLFALVNAEAAKNIYSNTLTQTGKRYQSLVSTLSGQRTETTRTIIQTSETTKTTQEYEPISVRRQPAIMIGILAVTLVIGAKMIYLFRKRSTRRST
jgi:hypothetical protein